MSGIEDARIAEARRALFAKLHTQEDAIEKMFGEIVDAFKHDDEAQLIKLREQWVCMWHDQAYELFEALERIFEHPLDGGSTT